MLEVYFGVLICLSGPVCDKYKNDKTFQIIGKEGYFSLKSCEESEYRIAQAMYIRTGDKYAYKCVKSDYQPPKIEN